MLILDETQNKKYKITVFSENHVTIKIIRNLMVVKLIKRKRAKF